MNLFSAQQIHDWDAFTIAHEPVASIDLMERAARTCTDFILNQMLPEQPVKIFCGKGNNGGDGLAIARQLADTGVHPVVYILEFGARGTDDFQENLHRLHDMNVDIHFIQATGFFPLVEPGDLVIDALYGSGLNRPLQDLSAALVHHINDSKATVIAIDVPSGMFINSSSAGHAVIRATCTLTFQSLKLCFLVAENADMAGEVHVMDIGLHPAFPATQSSVFSLTEPTDMQRAWKPRKPFAHKGQHGHALLVAGNPGKMGAALLAAKACLRTGAGLLTAYIPESMMPIFHTALPEAMCMDRSVPIAPGQFSAAGIGPGLGTADATSALVFQLLASSTTPVVLDADALNILAGKEGSINKVPANSILTPHPKEFDRLFGPAMNEFDRLNRAVQLSEQHPFTIILKGHYTLVAHGGQGWFNCTGNAGLAKGGSGDVLTGMLTALLAQGYDTLSAARLGVYLHGLAADIASRTTAMESMLASDVTGCISDAILSLQVESQAEQWQ